MPTETLMMKDSKNTWYGNIPTDWVINKYKFICKILSGDAMSPEDLDDSYEYEVYGGGKLIGFANSYNTQNCILIGRVGANCGCITNISDKCWATDNALILKTSSNKNYMNYLLMASNLNDINESNAQPLITASKVLNFKIPFTCNINEQQAIAIFLDEKCEKIDKVIGEIEEQIQVLEDYKKSLITETVTKGLDKNVPMKNSGIDWIGQISQNWNIKRLKYIGNARNGLTYEPEDMVDEDGILVLRSSNIQDNKLSFDDNVYVKMLIPKQLIVKENDLLICSRNGSRNLIGKCALIDKNTAGNSYGAFMCVFRSEYNRFIRYVLLSDIFNYYLSNFLTATINQLTNMQLGNIKAPIPPINVMKCIVDYLDKECKKIDKTISDKKEQLETIKEYKKSLIYEYVTGKKRVAC